MQAVDTSVRRADSSKAFATNATYSQLHRIVSISSLALGILPVCAASLLGASRAAVEPGDGAPRANGPYDCSISAF